MPLVEAGILLGSGIVKAVPLVEAATLPDKDAVNPFDRVPQRA